MPLYNMDEFAKDFEIHLKTVQKDLAVLQMDYRVIRALTSEDRKKLFSEVANDLINIPGTPEFIEAMLFSTIIEFLNYLIVKKMGGEVTEDEPLNPF